MPPELVIDVASDVPVTVISPVERSQVTPGTRVNATARKGSDGSLSVQSLDVVAQP